MGFSSKYKRALLARFVKAQEGRCCYCRRSFTAEGKTRATIEHKKAKMDGGQDRVANLAAACEHCNALRGKQMNEARLKAKRSGATKKPVMPAQAGIQLGSGI